MNLTTKKKGALGGIVIVLAIVLFVTLFVGRKPAVAPAVPAPSTATTPEAQTGATTPATPGIAPAKSTSKSVVRGCAPYLSITRSEQMRTLNLKWNPCPSDNFQLYTIYRNGAIINKNSDSNLANYIDKNLVSGTKYQYKVCVSQAPEIFTCSNTVSATF